MQKMPRGMTDEAFASSPLRAIPGIDALKTRGWWKNINLVVAGRTRRVSGILKYFVKKFIIENVLLNFHNLFCFRFWMCCAILFHNFKMIFQAHAFFGDEKQYDSISRRFNLCFRSILSVVNRNFCHFSIFCKIQFFYIFNICFRW